MHSSSSDNELPADTSIQNRDEDRFENGPPDEQLRPEPPAQDNTLSSTTRAEDASPTTLTTQDQPGEGEMTVRRAPETPLVNEDATVRRPPLGNSEEPVQVTPKNELDPTVNATPLPSGYTQPAPMQPTPPPAAPLSYPGSGVHTNYTPPSYGAIPPQPSYPASPTPPPYGAIPTQQAYPGNPTPPPYGTLPAQQPYPGAAIPPPAYPGSGVHPPYPSQPSYTAPRPRPPVVPPADPNWAQRLLIRFFQPTLASNPLLSVILGGLAAALLGVLTFSILITIINSVTPHPDPTHTNYDQATAYSWWQIIPLQNAFREGTELLTAAHGATFHIQRQYTSTSTTDTSTTATGNASSTFPLHGLLILPALFLILGGYLAASSDFHNNRLQSLLRGAAIAVPYTLILLLFSTQVNGNIPNLAFSYRVPQGILPFMLMGVGNIPATLTVDIGSLLLFGLLWGALFGLIGASLKLARGHWREGLYTSIQASPYFQLLGVIVGGIAAGLLGLALTLLLVFTFLAATTFSVPLLTNTLYNSTGNSSWQFLTFWGIAQGPLHAVNLFAMALGAPVTIHNECQQGLNPCTGATNHPLTSVGLLGGTTHPAAWVYLLIVVAALSLFISGRMSAAMGRARGTGPAAVQGALIAIPFTVLMVLLSLLATSNSSFSLTDTSTNGTTSSINEMLSLGVAFGDVLLWSLLSSVLFGALGGAYQASSFKIRVRTVLRALALPFVLLCKPIFFLLDLLTRRSRTQPRSQARGLLYGAFVTAVLMLILTIVGGLLLISLNQTLTVTTNHQWHDILAALLIALPGLFLISAAAVALKYDAPELPPVAAQPLPAFAVPVAPAHYYQPRPVAAQPTPPPASFDQQYAVPPQSAPTFYYQSQPGTLPSTPLPPQAGTPPSSPQHYQQTVAAPPPTPSSPEQQTLAAPSPSSPLLDQQQPEAPSPTPPSEEGRA